jgi:hypothetical protein
MDVILSKLSGLFWDTARYVTEVALRLELKFRELTNIYLPFSPT